ncbi:HAMP domain-containing histidine kinase [Paenibacillus sp. N3/727]|uniref:sensor histidine kinase n=1 Tax=Paenibacillus sp. N3/727 TaxID=2925845 RepID=UPI001F53112C|nr:HAMP domain-containing sensor histidine kinase [Paenibacillus sp. N3/727]UNK17903.1 HAMP domain-containing histidine kinase [Paenibacillus sp. N3/727]
MTLKTKLSLVHSLILMVMLIVFGMALYFFLHQYIYKDIKKNLAYEAGLVRKSISYELEISRRDWNLLISIDERASLQKGMFFQITNFFNGAIIKSSNLGYLELPVEGKKVTTAYFDTVSLLESPVLIYSAPLTFNGDIVGVVQSAVNVSQFENFFKILRYALYILTLSVVLLAVVSGRVLSKVTLKPLQSMIEDLEKIRNTGELKNRVFYKRSKDEVGTLVTAINFMLESIEINFEKINYMYINQQRFVADASHELRTPLTSILGNAQLLQKVWLNKSIGDSELEDSIECIHDIVDEAERMRKLVNDLLFLARSDSRLKIELQEIEFKPIVEKVIRQVDVMPKKVKWLHNDISVLNNVYILGNSDYVQQLLLIFIDNAFKYTLEGSVELSFTTNNNMVGISIKDTGIGLDKSEIPCIFDRFYRADHSRGKIEGTGLGLSIAKFIIDEHHASVEVTSSKDIGSTFTIWFREC